MLHISVHLFSFIYELDVCDAGDNFVVDVCRGIERIKLNRSLSIGKISSIFYLRNVFNSWFKLTVVLVKRCSCSCWNSLCVDCCRSNFVSNGLFLTVFSRWFLVQHRPRLVDTFAVRVHVHVEVSRLHICHVNIRRRIRHDVYLDASNFVRHQNFRMLSEELFS
jgi:hypothetical protein